MDRYLDRPGQPYGAPPDDDHPYVVEVQGVGETSWTRNGLSFASVEQADAWGWDLMLRWFGAENYRVVDARTGEVCMA